MAREAPNAGAKPVVEPEPETRSDGEQQSSAASTADTENVPGAAQLAAAAELPTRGSAGHGLGACKPCAFFYKEPF